MSNYKTEDDILQEFSDDMWYLFHDETIDSAEDFKVEFDNWIDGATIYREDCKTIVNAIDDIYLFWKHEIFGRPRGWEQAAYNALYDLLMAKGLTWAEMSEEHDRLWEIEHGQRTNLTIIDKTKGYTYVYKNIRESAIHEVIAKFEGNTIEWATARGDYFKLEVNDESGK